MYVAAAAQSDCVRGFFARAFLRCAEAEATLSREFCLVRISIRARRVQSMPSRAREREREREREGEGPRVATAGCGCRWIYRGEGARGTGDDDGGGGLDSGLLCLRGSLDK